MLDVINIEEINAFTTNLSFKMDDSLNFHDSKTLYVLRNDGHYDLLYKMDSLKGLKQMADID